MSDENLIFILDLQNLNLFIANSFNYFVIFRNYFLNCNTEIVLGIGFLIYAKKEDYALMKLIAEHYVEND